MFEHCHLLVSISEGTFHQLSAGSINVLADARSTAAWFSAGNSIYSRLDLAGYQVKRYEIRIFLCKIYVSLVLMLEWGRTDNSISGCDWRIFTCKPWA